MGSCVSTSKIKPIDRHELTKEMRTIYRQYIYQQERIDKLEQNVTMLIKECCKMKERQKHQQTPPSSTKYQYNS